MDCSAADLVIERFERVERELAHELELTGLAEIDAADAEDFLFKFQSALDELQSIDVPTDLPPSMGFADPTILAEAESTAANLAEAVRKCRGAIERMELLDHDADSADDVSALDAGAPASKPPPAAELGPKERRLDQELAADPEYRRKFENMVSTLAKLSSWEAAGGDAEEAAEEREVSQQLLQAIAWQEEAARGAALHDIHVMD